MNYSRITKTSAIDSETLCKETLRGFGMWIEENDGLTHGYVKYNLRRFIQQYLQTTTCREVSKAVSIPRRTAKCDLVIDDRIGIKIIYTITNSSKEWIYKQLRPLCREYEHVIIYGHQIAPEHLDIWYQIKRSLERGSRRWNKIHTLQTVTRIEYRIPLTTKTIRKEIAHKTLIYFIFVGFVVAGGQFLALTDGSDVMAQAYVGALITFNVFVILLGTFLVREM